MPDTAAAWRFTAIGTDWQIDAAAPLEAELRARVAARIEEFDRAWSRFRDDSIVARIAREPGTHVLPAEAGELLALYRQLYEATGGAMSPLVGGALDALGYDRDYTLRPHPQRQRVPAWEDAIAWDGERLAAPTPVLLDVGAAGKGLLVDIVHEMLAGAGIHAHIVDASGDILHRGPQPLRVALEHPADPTRAVGIALVQDAALCASATNRRAWGDGLHHVLDARTGLPTRDVIATWVVAGSAMVADGLATALFFAEPSELAHVAPFEWVRITSDGRLAHSSGFEGEVFA